MNNKIEVILCIPLKMKITQWESLLSSLLTYLGVWLSLFKFEFLEIKRSNGRIIESNWE